MAEYASAPKPTVRQRVRNELWATTPGWSRRLLVVAFLVMIAGLVLPLFFNKPAEPVPASAGATPSPVSGFAPSGAPDAPAPSSSPATTSSIPGTSTAVALGLSFFAGFIVAWILRLFFKIGLLIAGLLVAGVVALKYFGVDFATPDMSSLTQHARDLGQQASDEAGKLMAYVKTVVPSGVAAAAGLSPPKRQPPHRTATSSSSSSSSAAGTSPAPTAATTCATRPRRRAPNAAQRSA